MKILRFVTLCVSISIIVAFFAPWIKGEGSIVKAVDDTTKKLQEIDKTGLAKGVVQSAKGITDKATEAFTSIRLKRTLSGFQIPSVKNKSIKKLGAKVNLVYLPPFIAFLCCLLSLMGKRKLWPIVAIFFLGLGMFLVLNVFVGTLHKDGLFAKVWPCCGLIFTVYAFLAIMVLAFLQTTVSVRQEQNQRESINHGYHSAE